MSVFLRWGVFGILGVAALLYAYNASKRLAESHAVKPRAAASQPAEIPAEEEAAEQKYAEAPASAPVETAPDVPAHCEAELVVAQRAIDLKKAGEPFDRVLRMREISWEEVPARRERLEKVAAQWYGYEGSFKPAALRVAVINDCQRAAPAP
jgi:hypothetical protein